MLLVAFLAFSCEGCKSAPKSEEKDERPALQSPTSTSQMPISAIGTSPVTTTEAFTEASSVIDEEGWMISFLLIITVS